MKVVLGPTRTPKLEVVRALWCEVVGLKMVAVAVIWLRVEKTESGLEFRCGCDRSFAEYTRVVVPKVRLNS